MAKYVYPVVLHSESKGGYSVDIPDLKIGTQGETVAECISMARDAIELWGICQQDKGRAMPKAASLNPAHEADEIVQLVDINF